MSETEKTLTVRLALPRGFCAGVTRAVQIVERALEKFGAPVYVRHEIVHNRFVVDSLAAKGAVFVEELSEVPDRAAVVFSAHGVPRDVWDEAERKKLRVLDATCPLVAVIHAKVRKNHEKGVLTVLIGHNGHPEVEGIKGQVPPDALVVLKSADEAGALSVPPGKKLSYVTQTTFAQDEVADIIAALRERFPDILEPKRTDICYATTNRQNAVKVLAPLCERILIVGAPNSSNSRRLVDTAQRAGCPAFLIQRAEEIGWPEMLEGVSRLGISAGASAPEILVKEVLDSLRRYANINVTELIHVREDNVFPLPKELE